MGLQFVVSSANRWAWDVTQVGRGEAIRTLCADNGLELQEPDILPDWPQMKTSLAFGQLPQFVDGDLKLVQSNAILRYLARRHNLYGSNDKEASLMDMINDGQEDLRSKYVTLIYTNYENGKAEYVKNLPNELAKFERLLAKNNGGKGFFVGEKISYLDYNMLDLLDINLVLSPSCLADSPLLKAYYERMVARSAIAKYRQTEQFKNRPINGNGKQ